ncbi:MAG: hypothetical protein RLZZ546_3273, partial [Bacteroidota bacterium]
MLKRFLFVFSILHFTLLLSGQEIKWRAEYPTEAFVNSPFEVSFILENANGVEFIPPKFKNVQVVSGPSISESLQIINGESSSTSSYTFNVASSVKGPVSIESASIKVKGKTLTTQPFSIKIEEAKFEKSTTNKNFLVFLKAKPSVEKAYLGQQIMINYVLYYAENIGLSDEISLPNFDGFFTKKLNNAKSTASTINDGKHLYEGLVVDAIALYPSKQGRSTIPAARAIIKKRKKNSDPFFDPYNAYEESTITSNTLDFDIKPLPIGAPISFTGAVGNYKAIYTVLESQSTSNGTIVLNIEVIGDGDSKQVGPPKLNLTNPLKTTEPKLLYEREFYENNKVIHQKKYEYLIFSDDKV